MSRQVFPSEEAGRAVILDKLAGAIHSHVKEKLREDFGTNGEIRARFSAGEPPPFFPLLQFAYEGSVEVLIEHIITTAMEELP